MARTKARATRESQPDDSTIDAATIFTTARALCEQAKSRAAMLRERASAMHDEATALERFVAHTADGMSNSPTLGEVPGGNKYYK